MCEQYRAALVWCCMQGLAPIYLRELCCLVLAVPGIRLLRSAEKGVLVPFARSATMQNRAFAVVGPMIWNGLPPELRLHPGSLPDTFLTKLKTVLCGRVGVGSALSSLLEGVLYKFPNELMKSLVL